jgi:hypothetical protein
MLMVGASAASALARCSTKFRYLFIVPKDDASTLQLPAADMPRRIRARRTGTGSGVAADIRRILGIGRERRPLTLGDHASRPCGAMEPIHNRMVTSTEESSSPLTECSSPPDK